MAAAVEEGSTLAAEATSSSTENEQVDEIQFKIQYGKDSRDVKRPYDSTVGDLKTEIEKTLGIPTKMQKLMFKGMLKDDTHTLRQAGLKTGAKVLLIGSSPQEIATAKPEAAPANKDSNWDEAKLDEPLAKQAQHSKVLAKGRPEDGLPGIKDKQVPLTDDMKSIPSVLNGQGNKVRLTFKPELAQLWIGSATSTQKVPYSSITKIEAFPIEGQEEYSMLCLQLGNTTSSKYWLYYYPSQYVAGFKIRILGVQSLI